MNEANLEKLFKRVEIDFNKWKNLVDNFSGVNCSRAVLEEWSTEILYVVANLVTKCRLYKFHENFPRKLPKGLVKKIKEQNALLEELAGTLKKISDDLREESLKRK